MKQCRQCGVIKPLSEFYADNHYADGKKADCKVCYTRANVERMRRNKEQSNKQKRNWEASNRDAYLGHKKKYRREHPERIASGYNAWVARNPGKRNALHSKRRAAKLRSMPAWADQKKIRDIYDLAARLTAQQGIRYHVDHIIPLQSDLVCGLHVENNLQVITATENISKHNKFDVRLFA